VSTRRQRAERVGAMLDALYPLPEIPLRHGDPFTLLIAVILSAQCTDQRVNEVSPRLFRLARTPARMAALDEDQIEAVIHPCGLSRAKARSIRAAAAIIQAEFGGRVPDTFEELERLPGVGHKTASVVMAQAFGKPAFPVDTHVHRLAARWRLSSGRDVRTTEADLKKLYPPEDWHRRHLQFIYYGREHCTARGCDGTRCGICRACRGGSAAPRDGRGTKH
jgi:endonuclease III